MEYTVRQGDTIAAVTRLLNTDWQTIKRFNPKAVGRSNRNGNWFLKEGRTIEVPGGFREVLSAAQKQRPASAPTPGKPSGQERTSTGGTEIIHTVKPGDTIWELGVKRYHVDPDEIMALNDITDPTRLQPGQQLRIRLPDKGGPREVVASWYGTYHHGLPMANGEPFDMHASTIAHKDIPLGTKVELENPETGVRVRAVVTDRGPYVAGRDVDLSYGLAEQLSLERKGVGNLIMRVL